MSVNQNQVVSMLATSFPYDILDALIGEYQQIKRQLVLRKYQPTELQGGRFGECVIRLLQILINEPATPLGQQIRERDRILNTAFSDKSLPEGIRFFVTYLVRVILDVRSKRNVAHIGSGEIDPNYSDSLLISQSADWILIELIRNYYGCPIDEARKIVESINQTHLPIIADIDGVLRVQKTGLSVNVQTLLLLYYKNPTKVSDSNLIAWTEYANASRYRRTILPQLHKEVLIHYSNGYCQLTPKGVIHVEQNLPLDFIM